jgi:hypothetical protein
MTSLHHFVALFKGELSTGEKVPTVEITLVQAGRIPTEWITCNLAD